MKTILNYCTSVFFLLLLSFTASAQVGDCNIVHEGVFTYQGNEGEIKVVIKKKTHTEYHQGGKYIIKSSIVWTSDCAFTATMIKVTIPDFPFKAGETMNVKIDKIKGNEIYYTSTVQGHSWPGMLTKIK